ncbi:GMP synthase [Beauveria bassiana ARSEF 2860]|uniref:GMP synthase n=1 Tax=Beauveria bassiana (strain ARSEF 2860) TaxID=655819 RepID=J5K5U5_BEAB2|nr:GMP synthase [Beauveria bassiana ARSEF 2860]EJP69451.1 GMP synthase [Beauveria bassiana ARSEF 2860]
MRPEKGYEKGKDRANDENNRPTSWYAAALLSPTLRRSVNKRYYIILTLDFAYQFFHLLIRGMREFNVHVERLPCTQKAATWTGNPRVFSLSGDPDSVNEERAPHVDPAWLDFGVSILGVCYGKWSCRVSTPAKSAAMLTCLFKDIGEDRRCWMSHGNKLAKVPDGFHTIATTKNSEYADIGHSDTLIYAT